MKKIARLSLLAAVCCASVAAMAGEGWLTSYKDAMALAKKTGKPVLADFTGSDWCSWCMKLDKEVFAKPAFKTWAKDRVILLKVDFPNKKPLPAELKKQNDDLATVFKISSYPTILFIDASGKKLGEYGYDEGGPKIWTKKADAMIVKGKATK